MPLTNLLAADRIVILTEPGNRQHVLDAAARLLADSAPALAKSIGQALHERESVASTAIGHGVAIPHARTKAHDAVRGAFLRLAYPVDFGAGDDMPVDLVFAMSVPEHSTQLHLQTLSELAEYFTNPEFRDALRGARDLPALRQVLLDLPRATMSMTAAAQ